MDNYFILSIYIVGLLGILTLAAIIADWLEGRDK